MKLDINLICIALLLNGAMCLVQFLTQEWELKKGKIPPRRSKIAGTNQFFNHWQDAHCPTWGDLVGIGLVIAGFTHLAYYHRLTAFDWVLFTFFCGFGAWFWYKIGTGPKYKPNWCFPRTGQISWGGIMHLPYFGLGLACTVICLAKLLAGELHGEVLYLTGIGWLIYLAAVVVDTILGHKDAIEHSATPPLTSLVQTGRLRGTIFTFLFTLAGFIIYGDMGEEKWTVALLAALACALLHMSIMTFNDWFDRRHDLKKGKRLAFDYPQAFFRYWIKLTTLTLACIIMLMCRDAYVGLLCLTVLSLGLIYSYLENIIVLNNLIVAACGASPLLCGAVYFRTGGETTWTWYGVFFTLILGRELVKDIEDAQIDKGYKHTLAVALGVKRTKQISLLITGASAFFIMLTKKAYEALVLLGALLYKFIKWDPTSNPRKLVLLFDTLLGILVICLVVPVKYGDREIAMLDLWSIAHFFLGIVLYALLRHFRPEWNVRKRLLVILGAAYAWELLESALELGVLGEAVSAWKKGCEHWTNRLIADPLLTLLGGYSSSQKPNLWKWVVVPWLAWGVLNYLSPTSMYIQEYIISLF